MQHNLSFIKLMNYYDIHLEYMESSKELKIGLNLDNLILFDEKWKV